MFAELKQTTVNSTLSGHRQFRVTFRKTYLPPPPNYIAFKYFDNPVIFPNVIDASNLLLVGCRNLINLSPDHETLD